MKDRRIDLNNIIDNLMGESERSKIVAETVVLYSNSVLLSAVVEACANSDIKKKNIAMLVSSIIDNVNEYIQPLLKALDSAYEDTVFDADSFARGCGLINEQQTIKIQKELLDGGGKTIKVSISELDNRIPDEFKDMLETMMTQPPVKA